MRAGVWLRRAVLAGSAALVLWWLCSSDEIRRPPGVLVPGNPKQTLIKEPQPWWRGPYQITPLAELDIQARVLSKERYYMGRETDLSPLDLVLGWGPMSDQQVLDKLTITQSGRWFYWRYQTLPLPRAEIESHCANMHIIPATGDVAKTLKSIRRGSLVHIAGHLVGVQAKDGWSWRSSLSRDDTGSGSCEVVWVSSVTKDDGK